jgi:hypothetical protein
MSQFASTVIEELPISCWKSSAYPVPAIICLLNLAIESVSNFHVSVSLYRLPSIMREICAVMNLLVGAGVPRENE